MGNDNFLDEKLLNTGEEFGAPYDEEEKELDDEPKKPDEDDESDEEENYDDFEADSWNDGE